jgi:hypothetical protein
MSLVRELVRDLVGMFVDDENLALMIFGVIGIAGLATWLRVPEGMVGSMLTLGCVAALVESTLNVKHGNRRK